MNVDYLQVAKIRLDKSIRKLSDIAHAGDRILDVGGGQDFKKQIRNLSIRYQHVNGSDLDVRRDPLDFPSGTFEGVLAWEILEHLWEINLNGNLAWDGVVHFWNECFRVLKPGGFFFLTTPNRLCPRTLRTLSQGLQPQIYPALCLTDRVMEGHVREISGDELIALMHSTGSIYDYELWSEECYAHDYGMGIKTPTFLSWKKKLEALLGRVLESYEKHDTLFFVGKKPYNQDDEFLME